MESNNTASERYNPITGTGIPVNPARANTSAIFGGSPGSIEYMFIPPSATTRPTKPSTSHERKRSASRESLRRCFPPVSEGQPDSADEYSSVSDVSECGSEAGRSYRSRRNSNTSLGKSSKPLTRTTSSRLPSSGAKPRVMKRAHSFTRENTGRPARGQTQDMRVTHSASDLTNQTKRPGAIGTSKIPRKQASGSQSSRIPLKRADVNSAAEPQASGIPVKATGVQKRFTDDSRAQTGAEAGTSSGIPVKSSASRTQLHPGISKIPQSKRDRSQVNKGSETRDWDEGRRKSVDKENNDTETAVQAGEQLLKREGTGDELRVTKPEATKSKLPRRSSIPRASSRNAAQQKMKNEHVGEGSTTEKSKQNVNNESCQSGSKAGTNTEQHGGSRIPVNKRAETKTAGSGIAQRAETGRGVTKSVSKDEKPVAETGDEFSLSRENSRSKIPIMSRKGRASTNAVGNVPNDSEAPRVVEARKRRNEKQQQESRAPDDGDSQESLGKHSVCEQKMPLQQKQESGKQSVTCETSNSELTLEQFQKREQENVCVNGGKQQECDVLRNVEEIQTNDKKVEITKEHFALEKTDILPERGGLVTRIESTENLRQEDLLIAKNNAVTSSTGISDKTDVSFNTKNDSCDVETSTGSSDKHEILLSGSHQHKITNYAEKSNDGKNGMKTKTGLKEHGGESTGARSKLMKDFETEDKTKASEKIAGDGSTFQEKVERPSCFETPWKDGVLRNENNNKNNNNRRGVENEMTGHLGKARDSSEEISQPPSFFDEYLAVSGVEREDKATKKFENCLECRMEQNEDQDGEFIEMGEDDGEENSFRSNVRRYPTFISPRKSLVLCKHHEKLKNERGGELCNVEEPSQQHSQSSVNDDQLSGVSPQALSDVSPQALPDVVASKDLAEPLQQGPNQNGGTTNVKEEADGGNTISQDAGSKGLTKTKVKDEADGGNTLNNTISQDAGSKDLTKTKAKDEAGGGNTLNNTISQDAGSKDLTKTKVKKTTAGGGNTLNNTISQDAGSKDLTKTKVKEEAGGGNTLNNTISQDAGSKDLTKTKVKKTTAGGGNTLNNTILQDAGSKDLTKIKVKKTTAGGGDDDDDKPNNNVSQIMAEPVFAMDRLQRQTQNNKGVTRDINSSTMDNQPAAVETLNKRIPTVSRASEKDTHKETVPKKGGSPLLALSRDKKYVSGENLAPSKNAAAIKSALSLEWDDIGTELSPPNFSEDDEEISESGSRKQGEELEDERRPSVKLMNTNEALDKLKMIQSLIMKEAENRSRKESREGAGKRATDMETSQTTSTSSTLDRQLSGGHRENKELGTIISDPSFQTSETPDRDVSSPTIWDRISDEVTSQDQTTELLNETLAKLKASPQFSGNSLSRRTISSRSLPGSRQASKERLLSDAERPVYVYTSSWMNASGKNSVASSLSLCSANRSLPSSRQNLAKDPLKRSESLSGRIEKENEKQSEYRERKEFRLSDFDEMLSEDGQQEVNNQMSNNTTVSPVSEIPGMQSLEVPSKKALKMSKRKKKSKNTAETMNTAPGYGVSMEDLADGKTTCQCGKKGCVIS